MGSSREPEDHSAVPELAPECDVARLPLTPAEGFLLSRIDGHTPWGVLRECGALPADEVDGCLRGWLEQGVVSLAGKSGPPPVASACDADVETGASSDCDADVDSAASSDDNADVEAGPSSDRDADVEARLDPALDLPLEQQRAVLAFEQRLDRPYAEILGVPSDADARALRRAYFKLSKEFHPDRYFRKNLGPFAERLERVFCRIAEAYELLSDPSARAEMEKSMAAPAEPSAPSASRTEPARPRLRGRTTPHAFSLVARIQRERRRRARQFFEDGSAAIAAEDWTEAAQKLRLAIACDPGNAEYKAPFGEANRRANEIRAERYLKEARSRYELGEYETAYKRYVEALHCRPYDAEANHRAAKLAWRIAHDLKAARDYAQRACEVEEENAEFRRTLAQVYAAAELHLNAQREFETLLRLAPGDEEARQEAKRMKKLARQGPRGGA